MEELLLDLDKDKLKRGDRIEIARTEANAKHTVKLIESLLLGD